MRTVIVTGLSIPKWLLSIVDEKRGDASRSRFVSRLIAERLGDLAASKTIVGD